MKENTIIVLGLGAIVYYLWNKGNKESMVIHHTKPMIIAENGEAPSWVRDAPEGTPISLPSNVATNPLNLPNLGIPWKDRPDMAYSNIGGKGRRRKYDKAEDKILAYCRRHPQSPQCIGLDWGQ